MVFFAKVCVFNGNSAAQSYISKSQTTCVCTAAAFGGIHRSVPLFRITINRIESFLNTNVTYTPSYDIVDHMSIYICNSVVVVVVVAAVVLSLLYHSTVAVEHRVVCFVSVCALWAYTETTDLGISQ